MARIIKAQPRQRPFPPGKIDNFLIDYMLYFCPMRQDWAFAIQDRQGHWWTAPTWTPGGKVMRTSMDGCGEYFLSEEHHMAVHDISFDVIDYLNTSNDDSEDFACVHYTETKHYVAWMSTRLIDLYNTDEWRVARRQWEEVFELAHPRPFGSPKSSHEISVRCAKMKHSRACRNKAYRNRQRKGAKNAG